MLPNDVAPLKYQVYKGISGKYGAVQFSPSQPCFYCTSNKKHKFYTGEVVRKANFSSKTQCPIEGCSGTLSSREGSIFIEMAPTTAPNVYNWDKKIMFSLSIKDAGQLLLAMKRGESVTLTHDPQAGTQNKGKIVKKLNYYVKDVKQGALLSLEESRKQANEGDEAKEGNGKKNYMVPLTADEVLVLASLLQAYLPFMLSW